MVSDDKEWVKRVSDFEKRITRKLIRKSRSHRTDSRLSNAQEPTVDKLKCWASEFRQLDPRYMLLSFFNDLSLRGTQNLEPASFDTGPIHPLLRYLFRSSFFTVWRPTSLDAIKRMILGEAVGKGIDIKGKSAKRGKLSGMVPFLQIHENRHKRMIRMLPKKGNMRLFFTNHGRRARDVVAERLDDLAEEMCATVREARCVLRDDKASSKIFKDAVESMLLDMTDPSIRYIDDYAPHRCGLEIPVRLFWEAFFVRQDCTRRIGSEYDTGRPSQPAFQDMNNAAILDTNVKEGAPRAVVLQNADSAFPMNPFELLMAYEENGRVLPVVSDFDCFLVGSRGVNFSAPMHSDQLDHLKWSVSGIEKILKSPPRPENWTSRWLEVLKEATGNKFHHNTPRFGFGDPKSYSIMENLIHSLNASGAVRHGAECFNYYFPQELDDEYLVISVDMAGNKPWKYVDVNGLQQILNEKIDQGYTFPMNPKWILCDSGGWSDIYQKLVESEKKNVPESLDIWFPGEVRKHIAAIRTRYPRGFCRQRTSVIATNKVAASFRYSSTAAMDLAIQQLQHQPPNYFTPKINEVAPPVANPGNGVDSEQAMSADIVSKSL